MILINNDRQECAGEELQKLQTTKNDMMSILEETKQAHKALDAERDRCQVVCEEVSADLNRIKDEEHEIYMETQKALNYVKTVFEFQSNPWNWWNPTVLIPSMSTLSITIILNDTPFKAFSMNFVFVSFSASRSILNANRQCIKRF